MRVKDRDTGKVVDIPQSQYEMWPGRYVRETEPLKPSKRAASSVSANGGTDKKKEG